MAVFLALGTGTSALVARQSAWLAVWVGVLFGIVTLLWAEPLLRLMGAEPRVIAKSALYLRIVAVPSALLSLMTVFGSMLRAAGDTKTPMKVGLWMNILHLVLDYLLIFGIASIPGFRIAGAAWATVAARLFGTVMLYVYLRRSAVSFSWRRNGPETSESGAILSLSAPAAAERLIMRLGQVLYFGLIVSIGTETYAAHTIAGNIEIFSCMPGYGLAVAATTLVGQYLGAGRSREANQFGIWTACIAVVVMTFAGLILFVLSPWLATWFTTDKRVIEMVVIALRIDAFAQPALALGLVLAGALQGAGDTTQSGFREQELTIPQPTTRSSDCTFPSPFL